MYIWIGNFIERILDLQDYLSFEDKILPFVTTLLSLEFAKEFEEEVKYLYRDRNWRCPAQLSKKELQPIKEIQIEVD